MKIGEILLENTNKITDAWFKDGFKTYKIPAKEKYQIADSDGTIQTLEGPVKYKKGFYIMTGPKGEQYPIPPEKFRELKDDQGKGIATPKKIIKVAKLADHDGVVNTSWGAKLEYTRGNDYIVKHGPNDYGVVKADIFAKTYKQNSQTATKEENLDEITRRNFLKGAGATAAAGALGAEVNVAKAMGGSTAREKILAMKPGEKFWYVKVKDPKMPLDNQQYVFSFDTFKNVDDARETIRQHFREYGYETDINIEVTLSRRK